MTNSRPLMALGLMSGTSMDGVDAALIRTDGETIFELGPALTIRYDGIFQNRIRRQLGRDPECGDDEARALARDLTLRHVEAVTALLEKTGIEPGRVDVIGFHGHTVLHRPKDGITRQIGDGQLLAEATGIPVVADFRCRDVEKGGQGAPLAALYHAAHARDLLKPVAVLNLGGVANVTWIGDDGAILAFDTGPGNALIDDWAIKTIGRPMDEDGRLARAGQVDERVLAILLADAYFDRQPPKSLDRNHFDSAPLARLAAADGAATLVRFTAEAVARARVHLPTPPGRWLICGGGRHNGQIMEAIREVLGAPVDPVDAVGWRGDSLEAEAFAFLAVRSLFGLPLTLPTTTGVRAPTRGGTYFPVPGRARPAGIAVS